MTAQLLGLFCTGGRAKGCAAVVRLRYMAWADTMVGDLEANAALAEGYRAAWGERAEHIRLLHDQYPAMPHSVIADKVGCDQANVHQVIKRYAKRTSLEKLREFQANRADIFDAVSSDALLSITDTHLSNASALQLMTISAIAYDKARLERGQATSINVSALVDVATLLRQRMAQGAGQVTVAGGTPEVT